MGQVIPDAAVEAAAAIVYRTSGRRRVMTYEHARAACEEDAISILEAAAPHMLADAWDEGREATIEAYDGRGDGSNPYRPTL